MFCKSKINTCTVQCASVWNLWSTSLLSNLLWAPSKCCTFWKIARHDNKQSIQAYWNYDLVSLFFFFPKTKPKGRERAFNDHSVRMNLVVSSCAQAARDPQWDEQALGNKREGEIVKNFALSFSIQFLIESNEMKLNHADILDVGDRIIRKLFQHIEHIPTFNEFKGWQVALVSSFKVKIAKLSRLKILDPKSMYICDVITESFSPCVGETNKRFLWIKLLGSCSQQQPVLDSPPFAHLILKTYRWARSFGEEQYIQHQMIWFSCHHLMK